MEPEVAPVFLSKLRAFAHGQLDRDERAAFAALIAPGLARVYEGHDEVRAFDGTQHLPPVPSVVAQLIRDIGWSLEDSDG